MNEQNKIPELPIIREIVTEHGIEYLDESDYPKKLAPEIEKWFKDGLLPARTGKVVIYTYSPKEFNVKLEFKDRL